MKKRILSALLTSALVLSMTACGGNAPAENSTQTSDTNSTTSAVTSESTTSTADTESSAPEVTTAATTSATTVETTTTVATTTEAPKEEARKELLSGYRVNYAMNGHFLASADGGMYVYDFQNDVTYKVKGDVVASVGNIALIDKEIWERDIVRLDDGKCIVSSKDGYAILTDRFAIDFLHEGEPIIPSSIPIAKIEESFSGNTVKFGLLGTDGEWLYEVSDKYSICNNSEFPVDKLTGSNASYYGFGDSMLIVWNNYAYVYSFKNDTITELGKTSGNFELVVLTEDYAIVDFNTHMVRYDEKTGVAETIYTADGHQITPKATDSYIKISDGSQPFMQIYDITNSKMLDFDLSEYDVNYVIGGNESFIAFEAKNPKALHIPFLWIKTVI